MAYITRGMKHPNKKAQEFDKEKIFVEKAGIKINCYDAIQAAAEDTDIYETLEKYGSLKPIGEKANIVFADLEEQVQDLRTVYQKLEAGKQAWERLDAKTREEYNHTPELFANEALDRLNNKIIMLEKEKQIKEAEAKKIEEEKGGKK